MTVAGPGTTPAYAYQVLRLYDTATGEVRELALRQPGEVGIYLCGPTVYGPPHLGHGRATFAYDILRRYLEWSGLHVRLVSNITDIDDKIIERAEREGRDAAEIAQRCEAVWFKAMRGIGVDPPTDVPHATAYVDEMIELVAPAGRDRAGLHDRRRRLHERHVGRGLRAARPPVARRDARRRRRT